MNDITSLQIRCLELQGLLDDAADDPVLGPQLRVRLHDAETELNAARQQAGDLFPPEPIVIPRAAIFLRGAAVQDSAGILPSLAGKALIQYEKMFIAQALHDEREAARSAGRQRRRRGSAQPGLLFTGTPRGSFGLEFAPLPTADAAVLEVHARSLANVANALVKVAESGVGELDETIRDIPRGVLLPLKEFMKTLADNRVEMRLAFSNQQSRTLESSKIFAVAERLEREVNQETKTFEGTFRGVTRESGFFDLKLDDGQIITGNVADDLTEEDLERIDRLMNQRCSASMQKTTVSKITGEATPSYVLLDAIPAIP